MATPNKEEILKAINTLSEFNGKRLNEDIPQTYCDSIWILIEIAQIYLKTKI